MGDALVQKKGPNWGHESDLNRCKLQIAIQDIYWSQASAERNWGVFFCNFGPANFRKIAGEFFSEFWWRIFSASFSALLFQGFRSPGPPPPKKKFTPKIHAQNCRHSYPMSLSQTQFFITPIFCLRGRPTSKDETQQFATGDFVHLSDRRVLRLGARKIASYRGCIGILAGACQTSQPTCTDLRKERASGRSRENCNPQMLNWNPLRTTAY